MDSNKAKIVADFLVEDFENEMQTTLRVIAAVPNDHLDHRPDSKSKTGLGLVRHITLEDEWCAGRVRDRSWTSSPAGGRDGRWEPLR